MLTTIAAFQEAWEAHMLCSRLRAEGIPAFVAHEYHIGNAWHYSLVLGGVKVQVPGDRREEAKTIEAGCRSGEFKALLEQDFDPQDEIRCPSCGSDEHWKRRPLPRAFAAIAISFMTGMCFPPLGWMYFCEKCGTKFMQPLCPYTAAKWRKIGLVVAIGFFILLSLALCLWMAFYTVASFVVAMVAIMAAARWAIGRIANLDTERKGERDER